MGHSRFDGRRGQRGGLALAVAMAALAAGWASPAGALDLFRSEDVSVILDTTLSVGASIRVSDRDSNLVYVGNGGSNPDPTYVNSDDGNLNYDKGDIYSVNLKSTFDLEAEWRRPGSFLSNVGTFLRANAFYDIIGNCRTCTQRTDLDSASRHRKSVMDGGVVGTQFTVLDAYLNMRFDVADRLLDFRVGNQVLSWGESIFFQGGINTINAIDVAKIRTPGSELKEALVPAPLVRISGEIVRDLSLEAYYQFNWNRTNVDPVGSYWATSDLVGRGAEGLYFGQSLSPPVAPLGDPGSNPVLAGVCGGALPDCAPSDYFTPVLGPITRAGIPRVGDAKPPRQGQYGVALRYFADAILTEFGAYYIHYHNKTPTLGMDGVMFGVNFIPGDFFRDYAEHINVVGASFSTELMNAALAGEISYRPDEPVAVNAQEQAIISFFPVQGPPVRQGGFVTEEKIQAQLNLIQTFGPSTRWGIGRLVELLGADDVALTSEIALVHFPNLPDECHKPTPTTESPEFTAARLAGGGCVALAGPPGRAVHATSWGYQMLMLVNYTNPFDIPITVTPSIAWQHDVHGNSPNQNPFIEERKAVTVGLEFDYLETWGAKATYANFFGAGESNLIQDRDFVSLSFSYAF